MTATLVPIDWEVVEAACFRDEAAALAELLARQPFSAAERAALGGEAEALVRAARAAGRHGLVEDFLQEFSLSTREGMALMCLAEALLRTPDAATRDALIAEKIGAADWGAHLGKSARRVVNTSAWGLLFTGRLLGAEARHGHDIGAVVRRLAGRIGEPLIRRAVAAAVGLMGDQFVLGRNIEGALKRARKEALTGSFDMLGEGARCAADAERYEGLYSEAIRAVGAAAQGAGPEAGHGVSVKLSALSPRFEATQERRVWEELYPRLLRLAVLAAGCDINLTIDAEEAERQVLTLRLLERLAGETQLGGWRGLGTVVQAYQKCAPMVIAALRQLARGSGRRLMVRLVKGAYWDSEIKRAQINGLPGYPVYTTKPATDLSYLVCAQALIEAAPDLYAQFATHNAHTLAAVRQLAQRAQVPLEHQRLHGMGETLYRAAQERYGALALRVYAPVGGHQELLAYLVRRLLENGANTSFVHTLLDERVPPAQLVRDPVDAVAAHPGPHPKIPLPAQLYGAARRNSAGRDLSQQRVRAQLAAAVRALDAQALRGGPIVGGELRAGIDAGDVTAPADAGQCLGTAAAAGAADVDLAFELACAAQPGWDGAGGAQRAQILRAMADALENNLERLVALIAREGGRSLRDGIAEVREAADFCRYYAVLAEQQFKGAVTLPGPVGERNLLELRGRGVFACISPWNFPLAIFTGQIAAALAAGNAVLAKPAEQTPLIAGEAVRLFHAAGLDPRLLALLPGRGETLGPLLLDDARLAGVAFTGGTDTAAHINRRLAARPGPILPLIAETGGLNGLFVDTTALPEQVVDDVMASAFGSAGQRCSALRVLFLPEAIADRLVAVLVGAAEALVVGDPADPVTDVGPVIDAAARAQLEAHLARLQREAKILYRRDVGELARRGIFFGPVIAEIPAPDFLEAEVFGPILHIYRYAPDELESAARAFAARGYGLTLGVHSRIDAFAARIRACVPAGNCYVNRSMIGAVVGVQPFGGEGLSGTGPKAGGPHTLLRYAVERSLAVNIAAQGGDPGLFNLDAAE